MGGLGVGGRNERCSSHSALTRAADVAAAKLPEHSLVARIVDRPTCCYSRWTSMEQEHHCTPVGGSERCAAGCTENSQGLQAIER